MAIIIYTPGVWERSSVKVNSYINRLDNLINLMETHHLDCEYFYALRANIIQDKMYSKNKHLWELERAEDLINLTITKLTGTETLIT